jgi:hypothetical protein
MKTLESFQQRTGDVGFRFNFDGDYEILILQNKINFITVVTAGPIT